MPSLPSFAALMVLTLAGCATTPRSERIPPRVRGSDIVFERVPGQVWIEPRWEFDGNEWRWQRGRYVSARPGFVYRQGYWDNSGTRWVYQEGGWEAVRPGWVRRRGYYEYVGETWVWRPGTWVEVEPGKEWVPGRWEAVPLQDRYRWLPGYWRPAS